MYRDELDALNGIHKLLEEQNQLIKWLGVIINELRIEREAEPNVSAANSSSRRKSNSGKTGT
ncbi:hypothetical protein D3C75_1114980 [compost metagenome]